MSNNLTYAKVELILDLQINLLDLSKITSKKTKKPNHNNIGSFGSVTKIPKNLKNVHLVASTDGVGKKSRLQMN